MAHAPLTYIEVSTGRVVETVGDPYRTPVVFRYRGEEETRKLSATQFYLNGWFVACKADAPDIEGIP
ncbi:MAG: hypothetical protein ABIP42_17700 [Planctomycetota bacterium]